MSSFVHLHTHSEYSTLDGASKIPAMVDKAIADGMKALAITDHGNMYGAKEFFNYVAKKNNIIKPIIGCEVYVVKNRREKDKDEKAGDHLVLLAKNKTGYHNLVKLVSAGFVEGFYYKPRIDKEILEKYNEGLIVSSACLGGEIPSLIKNGQIKEAEAVALWFKNLFGGDFYLEIQRHETSDPNASQDVYQYQKEINPVILDIARKLDIKVIATNDAHFLNEDDAEAHDRLLCVSTNANVNDTKRMRYTKQEWLKTQAEMQAIFSDIPEVITNTLEIADKVEFYNINNKAIMPDFPLPEGFSNSDEYLAHITMNGAKRHYGSTITPECLERIDFELETIKKMGYAGYFLIVQDFIAEARKMGVVVGPGRGSAAGCVVAYCLGITNIDPLKYELLFERFLNPDRISMPDIDIDFDDDGRAEVLKYVEQKYGKEKVAHIVTFGTMAAKSAIKDVARISQVSQSESDRLSKLIDLIPRNKDRDDDENDDENENENEDDKIKIGISTAIETVPEMREAANSPDPLIADTIKYAQKLEGTIRHTGVHACGIIICRDKLTDHVPICTTENKKTGERMVVTQYEGTLIEEVGMIKMDILGLRTLSIIRDAVENIEQSHGIAIDIENIPFDDKKTYELYSNGETIGTFQFESEGMRSHLRNLKPTKFEDLIAMNALYRPGPMEYIPDFINRKHGNQTITYDLPCMEGYLKETYGITVYQEQVMLLSRKLAGFTRGQSDELRKAMGKKDKEKMESLKVKFIKGAQANGHDLAKCEKIWSDWEKFAEYAFNKSHSTCYSHVAYQTAYLKANYPAEYMAAVLNRNQNDISKITRFMDECRRMGIPVLGPDINESGLKFTVNKKGEIRYALSAIKGVGETAVFSIMEERKKNGNFTSVFDFVERVSLSACNKKTIDGLASAGAFDNMTEIMREQFFATNSKGELFVDTLIRYGNLRQSDVASNANTLFGFDDMAVEVVKPEIPKTEEWSVLQRLSREREMIGIYLSAHPLDDYYVELNYLCNTKIDSLNNIAALKGKVLKTGGIVTAHRIGTTKKGNQYGVLTVEDFSGNREFALFGSDYVDYGKYLKKDLYVYLQGIVQERKQWGDAAAKSTELEFKITKMGLLNELSAIALKRIIITINIHSLTSEFANKLTAAIQKNNGKTPLYFKFTDTKNHPVEMFARGTQVNLSKNFISFLEKMKTENYLENFQIEF